MIEALAQANISQPAHENAAQYQDGIRNASAPSVYYVKYRKWWDTKHFRHAGQRFEESGNKFYCPFPKNTESYREFWDEQEYYIHNGYTHDGQRISGMYYYYLNYCQIHNKSKKPDPLTFPDFWAVDADFFLHLEKCFGHGPWEDTEYAKTRPVTFEVSKSRQVGASLKGCVPLLYNIQFVPNSINYLGSWDMKYNLKTFSIFKKYMQFQYKYCDFGKRWMEESKGVYYKAGYYEDIDGQKIDAGIQSELHFISFKDNPAKGVGGPCTLFVIEEAGLHPKLLTSVGAILPACKDGDITTGNILAYGAGDPEEISEDLKALHYNIDIYNGYKLPNIWDNDPLRPYSGYFVPNYSCRKGHMDEDGNPNALSAIQARDKAFADTKIRDHQQYLLDVSQYPNSGKEMFSMRANRRFPSEIIERQIALVSRMGYLGQPIILSEEPESKTPRWRFRKDDDPQPIHDWPITAQLRDKRGCPVIYEWPPASIPDGLYIASIDSYNQETSEGSSSLGCIKIYKRINTLGDETARILVAEYVGRPHSKNDFYKQCELLLKLYNAVALPENEDQELTPWFINNKVDYLLADQPDIIRQILPNSQVKRTKGIHADEHLIIAAENKIYRYLTEKIGNEYDSEGNITGERLGVTRILSLGLLKELLHYYHDSWQNFDRVRTFGWVLMFETELETQDVKPYSDEVAEWLVNTKRPSVHTERHVTGHF